VSKCVRLKIILRVSNLSNSDLFVIYFCIGQNIPVTFQYFGNLKACLVLKLTLQIFLYFWN
jgi:hypothetical protein